MSESLDELLKAVIAFRDDRDWAQFHTPRQLCAALSIEAAELQEILLWKDDSNVLASIGEPKTQMRLSHEIADVIIYALLLSHSCGIDPTRAIHEKLEHNAAKYPINKSRGNATKYSDLESR